MNLWMNETFLETSSHWMCAEHIEDAPLLYTAFIVELK